MNQTRIKDGGQPLQLQEHIRSSLEQEILDGLLPPGERLDEQAIAQRFGVSRTPVREALLQLSSAGLVQFRPRQGAIVARLTLKQIASIWEVLIGLEGMCAELAARRMTLDERNAVTKHHEDSLAFVQANDVKGYEAANQRIHEAIYAGCKNGYLQQHVTDIRRRLRIYRRYPFERAGGLQRSFEGHDKVIAALREGNDVKAGAAMRDHVTSGGLSFYDFIADIPDELAQQDAD